MLKKFNDTCNRQIFIQTTYIHKQSLIVKIFNDTTSQIESCSKNSMMNETPKIQIKSTKKKTQKLTTKYIKNKEKATNKNYFFCFTSVIALASVCRHF